MKPCLQRANETAAAICTAGRNGLGLAAAESGALERFGTSAANSRLSSRGIASKKPASPPSEIGNAHGLRLSRESTEAASAPDRVHGRAYLSERRNISP